MRLAGSSIILGSVLDRLALRRPNFQSAWEINSVDPDIEVRLESRLARGKYLDVELRSPSGRTALELKYVTRWADREHQDESFELADHRAPAFWLHEGQLLGDVLRAGAGYVLAYLGEEPGEED